ncbi:MAG: hypothetical protein JW779_11070 [Candidatus Thorarchaeota archaeon]|nr:hypothetical protein [Candidatus Thorarchaeota archaeon]
MKTTHRLIPIMFVIVMMVAPVFLTHNPSMGMTTGQDTTSDLGTREVDIGNGEMIELAPNEILHTYVLTEQGWVEWSSTSDPLIGSEYGNSINIFNNRQMKYIPGSATTSVQTGISIGTGWEAYEARVAISSLTENRTWITNPGFEGGYTGWTRVATSNAGYSTVSASWIDDGHGTGNDCVEVDINSDSTSEPFYYDQGDDAWYQQVATVNRGTVVWAALRMNFWADTVDDTHYGMTGSFRLYANIEGTDIWRRVFSDIGAEETWYDTGLLTVNPSVFGLPGDTSITTRIGMLSLATVGYAPNIHPKARFDNIVLYMKTLVNPSEINLQMNGLSISNSGTRGICSITQTPGTPWTTSPVTLTFTWTPVPTTPNPNSEIRIDFNINVNMFARHYDLDSLYEISPTSFGERFTIQNGTNAEFTSYFRANIPTGYANRYFFNETIPIDRDVYFVAQPLAPTTNLTSGWNGGDPGDGFLNVSTYLITTEPGRYGYWRILSRSPNMISDVQLWDPNSSMWTRDADLRAGDISRVLVNVGSQYAGSLVNITLYKPDGSVWQTFSTTVNSTGYATTSSFTLSGATAPAGSWMVQATTSNVGAGGEWTSVGLFKRPFTITHESTINLQYPTDAIGTMITNVTYGDLLLIILEVEDIDSSVLVPGGTLTLDWSFGIDTFDDNGNGQYTKVIDTSELPGKGQYTMDLDWVHPSFDPSNTALTININYAATLTSPDYPGISGPVGDDQSFTTRFANVNGTGITTANLWCNWSNPYTVVPLGLGNYEFQLDMTGIPIGEYPIEVHATGPFVEPQSMLMYVEAREIYNSISYTSSQLSIPLGEAASFVLTWTDTDHNVLISGSASSISCNWTPFHSSGDTNYTVVEISPGKYNITIFTKNTDPLTGTDLITVRFNVFKTNYRSHIFDIGVAIRKRNTLFVLDAPISQTPFGSTITVLVFYQDTDLRVGIGNATNEVKITITSTEIGTVAFTCTPSSLGLGHYNISIDSGQWGSIGWKDLSIFIEWTGVVDKFYSQTINTSARITGTDTDLYLEIAPTATYYLDTFTFTAVYYDTVGLQRISNLTNNVFILLTALDTGHSVTQSDFTIVESGTVPGTYIFTLDSTLFPSTDTFRFQLDFMWKKGAIPRYENATMVVSLIVLDRPTYIDYSPISSTPYGEDAELRFSFVDTLTSTKIDDSAQLIVSLNDLGVSFSYSFNALTHEFTLLIDTGSIGSIGVHIIHLNLTWSGSPFYASVTNKPITLSVILRPTQLSHLSFAPSQWGNNITIQFVYTDIVVGSTAGMSGTLTLNIAVDKYSVVYGPEGHFFVTINTTAFASDGLYSVTATVVHTNPNYQTAIETFDISVLKRSTQLGYDSPDPASYGSNVSLHIIYTDDSTGRGVVGATIAVTGNGTYSLVLNTNYWITYTGDGRYLIEVNTTALGVPGVYLLEIDVSFSGEPFYLPGSQDVIARVVERTTQILITQTPGEVPFQENVVFRFKYTDFLLGTKISIDQSDITLTHGVSHTVITSGQYTLNEYATYYEIIFSSLIINPSALETGHPIQITIDKGSGEPYYAPRSTSTSVTIIQRSTQILLPLVEDTPYYDNITIQLSYIDYLTETGIDDALLVISSDNWTVPEYTLIREGNGVYTILINSSLFGDIGNVYFDITLSKSGSPFYTSRTRYDVPATITTIQTSIIAEAPAAGSTAVGAPIEVTITLRDFDHDKLLEGAIISTNWTQLFGTGYTIDELGSGVYTITLITEGLLAQKFTFQVWAEKSYYATAIATVSVQPGAATVEIYLEKSTYYSDWGEMVNITFQVREPYYNTPVTGMTATLLWNGVLYGFTEGTNGYYTLLLDSSENNYGIYNPRITVTKLYYQQKQRTFTLVVSKATGQIIPESSLYEVVANTSVNIQIYLNDTVSALPVTTATVNIEFNGTLYSLTHIGGGFFSTNLPVTNFAIGQYPLIVRANAVNHVFLEIIIDVNIVPIYTELKFTESISLITAYFGDSINILVIYNDTYYNTLISNANISYTLGSLTGVLTEEANHTYSASIDISSLGSQSIYLRLTASKAGYATALRSIIVTILPIPTSISVLPSDALKSGYFGNKLNFTFFYNDLQHGVGIAGANVVATWEGVGYTVYDFGNGRYVVQVTLSITTPGLYDLAVRFNLQNYTARSITTKVEIYATPAQIYGPATYSSPINDTITIEFVIKNSFTSSIISDIVGTASSVQLGDIDLQLLPSGNYTLNLEGDLPYGFYSFTIYFATTKYVISPFYLEIEVRQVKSQSQHGSLNVLTQPGGSVEFTVTYLDADHNQGIPGANISFVYDDNLVQYLEEYTIDNDGTYTFYFLSRAGGTATIEITLSKDGFDTQVIILRVQSDISAEQQFQQTLTIGGGFGILIVALLLIGYVKVWSIPWLIRQMNRMIRVLSKGRVPGPPKVKSRQDIAMVIVNEEIASLHLQKPREDIAPEPIVTTVPEVNELLEELASITGLGEAEIEAFRADLSRMKASERPGFLKEVINQERARRADVLAKPVKETKTPEQVPLSELPGELEDLKQKLLKKGMASDEIDIIINEAKSLSKADLDALLDSLGIDLD